MRLAGDRPNISTAPIAITRLEGFGQDSWGCLPDDANRSLPWTLGPHSPEAAAPYFTMPPSDCQDVSIVLCHTAPEVPSTKKTGPDELMAIPTPSTSWPP